MNEPDLASQSNMNVDAAIKLWKEQMLPLASQAKLVSPAVTGTLEGIQWLTDFVKGCSGCKISAVAVHWYDRADVSGPIFSEMLPPTARLVWTERRLVQALPQQSQGSWIPYLDNRGERLRPFVNQKSS